MSEWKKGDRVHIEMDHTVTDVHGDHIEVIIDDAVWLDPTDVTITRAGPAATSPAAGPGGNTWRRCPATYQGDTHLHVCALDAGAGPHDGSHICGGCGLPWGGGDRA